MSNKMKKEEEIINEDEIPIIESEPNGYWEVYPDRKIWHEKDKWYQEDNMNEDLSQYSGETYYQRPPRMPLNEISLNGNKGIYRIKNVVKGYTEVDGKKTYEETELGESIKVVFLRVRRRLAQFKKGEPTLATSEHNSKADEVALFGGAAVEKGLASAMRDKYPGLRTQQVVYALYNNELVRLIVKGASLGSETKAEDVMTFYDYISSFKKDAEGKKVDEHFYQYETNLSAVKETSPLGGYYAIKFEKGKKLDDAEMENVAVEMKKIHEFIVSVDGFYGKKKEGEIAPAEEIETINIDEDEPKEETNLKDIPF
jgi:hypothetical protein